MLNVLKTTLVYTGIYFLFCIAWTILLIGAQVFWKPVVAMFFIILAVFTFGYIRDRTTVSGCFDKYWASQRS